ncbi:MAG: hypothetical protein KKH91_02165 [Elusimicrobia bacterium]|nr:hypothetical protein [Elusimicrobiota bacterium]MBU2614163.1 hypothetical protein [Elusimicrobiota bacterium]
MLTKEALKEFVLNEGISLFGVADAAGIKSRFILSQDIVKDLDRALVLGYRLSQKVLDSLIDKPSPLYYFHYQRANVLLDGTILKVAELIQREGFQALPVPSSQVIDWEKMKGTVSHREIAELAGLGWRGKNNLTVSPLYGSQVRYITLLTDMPLEADKPLQEDCGTCKLCAEVCPAGAIGDSPKTFDSDKCRIQLRKFEKIQFIGTMICGLCLKACKGIK